MSNSEQTVFIHSSFLSNVSEDETSFQKIQEDQYSHSQKVEEKQLLAT